MKNNLIVLLSLFSVLIHFLSAENLTQKEIKHIEMICRSIRTIENLKGKSPLTDREMTKLQQSERIRDYNLEKLKITQSDLGNVNYQFEGTDFSDWIQSGKAIEHKNTDTLPDRQSRPKPKFKTDPSDPFQDESSIRTRVDITLLNVMTKVSESIELLNNEQLEQNANGHLNRNLKSIEGLINELKDSVDDPLLCLSDEQFSIYNEFQEALSKRKQRDQEFANLKKEQERTSRLKKQQETDIREEKLRVSRYKAAKIQDLPYLRKLQALDNLGFSKFNGGLDSIVNGIYERKISIDEAKKLAVRQSLADQFKFSNLVDRYSIFTFVYDSEYNSDFKFWEDKERTIAIIRQSDGIYDENSYLEAGGYYSFFGVEVFQRTIGGTIEILVFEEITQKLEAEIHNLSHYTYEEHGFELLYDFDSGFLGRDRRKVGIISDVTTKADRVAIMRKAASIFMAKHKADVVWVNLEATREGIGWGYVYGTTTYCPDRKGNSGEDDVPVWQIQATDDLLSEEEEILIRLWYKHREEFLGKDGLVDETALKEHIKNLYGISIDKIYLPTIH